MSWLLSRTELTNPQDSAVELSHDVHRIILGSPGSGKTLVLLHRAKHLVDKLGVLPKRFRIFVFTRVLKEYISPALSELELPSNCVLTFDSWCLKFHRENIGRPPWERKRKGFDFGKIREGVWEYLRSTEFPKMYDFVMVDEGQDFDPIVYRILDAIAIHVTIFMDSKQQIYENGLDKHGIQMVLSSLTPERTLLPAFRCSPYIVRVSVEFILEKNDRDAFVEQNRQNQSKEGKVPNLYLARDRDEEKEQLLEVVRNRSIKNDRVAILVPTVRLAYSLGWFLTEKGIEIEIPGRPGSNRKKSLPTIDFASPSPKIMPYPSAKGLTFDSVLMPLLSKKKFSRHMNLDLMTRWLFVGITRATEWVYFSSVSDDCVFLRQFQKLESNQQLWIQTGPVTLPEWDNSEGDDDLIDIF